MSNVSGIVLDENGDPLDGANVFYLDLETGEWDQDLPGTFTQSLTGVFPGGYFSMAFIPSQQIKITHLGFEPSYINLPGENPSGEMDYFVEVNMITGAYEIGPVVIYPEEDRSSSMLPLLLAAIVIYNN